MENLIIVGGGGYFLEIYEYISQDIECGRIKNLNIKGVIADPKPTSLPYSVYISSVSDYIPEDDDLFIIAIGDAQVRDRIFNDLKHKGAKFYTYVHPTALVSKSASIGEGVIICPFCIVNSFSIIEDNVSLNVNSSIGHEAIVKHSSVLSPYSSLSGKSKVGARVLLGTRATLFPGVEIGDDVQVDVHSSVKSNCDEKMIISNRAKLITVKNRLI